MPCTYSHSTPSVANALLQLCRILSPFYLQYITIHHSDHADTHAAQPVPRCITGIPALDMVTEGGCWWDTWSSRNNDTHCSWVFDSQPSAQAVRPVCAVGKVVAGVKLLQGRPLQGECTAVAAGSLIELMNIVEQRCSTAVLGGSS